MQKINGTKPKRRKTNIDALQVFAKVLGEDKVETSAQDRRQAEKCTFPTHQKILGILHPDDKNEVKECLRLANEFNIPLYPLSGGKNWGYGSKVAPQNHSLLLSLKNLNRILDFDPDLAFVRIEPGVTFAQLNAFFKEQEVNFEMPGPGSTDQASVIGNTLERGLSPGFQGSRSEQVSAIEVLLPNGQQLCSGFGNFSGSKTGDLHPWGLGPSCKEMFFQSNLGIVTEMTLCLQPTPGFRQKLLFCQKGKLEDSLDGMRELMLRGLINGNCSLHNVCKVLSLSTQYPFPVLHDRTPLPREFMHTVTEELGGEWLGELLIGSEDEEILQLQRARILDKLEPSIKLVEIAKIGREKKEKSGLLHAYWRKKELMSDHSDPDADRCGLLWHCPVLPFKGQEIVQYVKEVEELLIGKGFEPLISIQINNARFVYIVISLVYDRTLLGEDRTAMDAYQALRKLSLGWGYYPYRLGIQDMEKIAYQRKDYPFWKQVKRICDPKGILAPGRYI